MTLRTRPRGDGERAVRGQVDGEVDDMVPEVYRGGRGTPLLLLHGAAMSWRAWEPVVPLLEERHRVLAPTLPGHRGGPAWSHGEAFSIDLLVDRVCDQLDEEGVTSAHVVGNSLGGAVGLELARRGRARSVVALSPAGTWRSGADLLRLVWTFHAMRRVAQPAFVPALQRWSWLRRLAFRRALEHGDRVSADGVRGFVDDIRACSVLAPMLAGVRAHGPTRAMPELSCPVRIAWAQHDRMIPWRAYGAPMRRVIPDAEFIRLRGVGHVPMWDDPELVVQTVLDTTLPLDHEHHQVLA